MRSTLVTVVLGLSLVAGCEVGDGGGGGGGGGGAVDGGRGVDAPALVPRLNVVVDKPTLATELGTTSQLTLTLGADGGFSGPVNLTATVVDSTNTAIPGWTVIFNTPVVTLASNGSGSAVATLTIPTENQGLSGTVKIQAASTLPVVAVTSAVTVANQVTINVTSNGGQCVYPSATPMRVKAGTKVLFVNKFATANITIHSNGGAQGIAHEADPGHAPNLANAYTQTFSGSGTFDWYCHAPGPNLAGNNPKFTVVP